ncbi:hypothetical protein DPMN_055866 [Dreissena polymorpha]|uniref:Uncharacterized protein n=1 Tax=Dreissena polymorpha TaxID=45954 RepID=A0A9D4CQP7_DREPO|nr:hypothetical protein DPMN_055866 [Dreissena polymorpha]
MVSVHKTARKCLGGNQAHMKRDHDVRLYRNTYRVGDLVYVLNVAGKAKKLLLQWNGPGIVVKKFMLSCTRYDFVERGSM